METKIKKKLLLLTTSYPRFKGDHAGHFVYTFAKKISSYFECKILAPSYKGAKNYKEDGIEVIHFSYFYPKRLQILCYGDGITDNIRKNFLLIFQIPFFILSFFLKAAKLCKESHIIHSHWIFPSGLIGAVINKIYRIKHIITVHSGGLYLLTKFPFSSSIIRFIYKNCEQIICVSNDLKKELIARVGSDKKISIIPMGVEINKPEVNKIRAKSKFRIAGKFVVLYIGRLVKIKGVKHLIHALSKIENVILYVAGDGGKRKTLKKLSERLGVDSYFLGYVSGNMKEEIFASSDVVVVPSIKTKSGRTEGVPLVILEALSYGKPVIGSDIGGIRDIIKNGTNGYLVEPRNISMLKNKIEDLQRNKKLYQFLATNAKKSANNYVLGNCVSKYVNICYGMTEVPSKI